MTFGSLFTGFGGLDLGLERAGLKCVWQCENNDYATKVLEKRWPHMVQYKTRFDDIRTVHWNELDTPDLICGGDPCQGNSNAASVHDRKHDDMGKEFIAVVEALRPQFVLRENPSVVMRGAPWPWFRFRSELCRLGYHVLPFRIRSCCLGHDHKRERLFLLAESSDSYCERPQGINREGLPIWFLGRACSHAVRPTQDVLSEPGICGAGDGIPNRVERLRGLGNAVDVCVAERIGRAIMAADQQFYCREYSNESTHANR